RVADRQRVQPEHQGERRGAVVALGDDELVPALVAVHHDGLVGGAGRGGGRGPAALGRRDRRCGGGGRARLGGGRRRLLGGLVPTVAVGRTGAGDHEQAED